VPITCFLQRKTLVKWPVNLLKTKIMKEIKAFVKPFKVNSIFNELLQAGYPNLTVSLTEGTGQLKGDDPTISTNFSITNSVVAKIEIVCNDEDSGEIIEIIKINARTGNPGDGIIYITNVEKVVHIRTNNEFQ